MPTTDTARPKQFLHLTPVLVTPDIIHTVQYYQDTLGFEKIFEYGEPVFYAGVSRDGFDFHFSHCNQGSGMQQPTSEETKVYITAADLDALYTELVGKGAKVVYGPATHDYGMREFHIEDCNGYRLAFGQQV